MPQATVTLVENASAFINESIRNARRAKREQRYWSFAIRHLIQGLELLMKHVLQLQHPLFIFENIDNQRGRVRFIFRGGEYKPTAAPFPFINGLVAMYEPAFTLNERSR